MTKRSLGLAWVICVLAPASCVSPEELRREDEATCVGYGFHPGTDAFANCVNAGEKMHQRAGVKLHQDGMPKACIGGLLLGDKQDEKRIASPENVTPASSVASPPMFPLPH
jgi:hypothetical protein